LHTSPSSRRFFRSINWEQLQAGQIPSPIRLDDINDFGPKNADKSKAQVPTLTVNLLFCVCAFIHVVRFSIHVAAGCAR